MSYRQDYDPSQYIRLPLLPISKLYTAAKIYPVRYIGYVLMSVMRQWCPFLCKSRRVEEWKERPLQYSSRIAEEWTNELKLKKYSINKNIKSGHSFNNGKWKVWVKNWESIITFFIKIKCIFFDITTEYKLSTIKTTCITMSVNLHYFKNYFITTFAMEVKLPTN